MSIMNTQTKTRKKRRVLIVSLAVLAAVALIAIVFFTFVSKYSTGAVTKISATVKSEDNIELQLHYLLSSGSYSVREVPVDEGEYIGDGMTDYDGSLGKYRIIVEFGDAELSRSVKEKMDANGYLDLGTSTVQVRAKATWPSDHGFVLYIGFDHPIHVEEAQGDLKKMGGSLRIPVKIDSALDSSHRNIQGTYTCTSEYWNASSSTSVPYIHFDEDGSCLMFINYFEGGCNMEGEYRIENDSIYVKLDFSNTIFEDTGDEYTDCEFMSNEYIFKIVSDSKLIINRGCYAVNEGDAFIKTNE